MFLIIKIFCLSAVLVFGASIKETKLMSQKNDNIDSDVIIFKEDGYELISQQRFGGVWNKNSDWPELEYRFLMGNNRRCPKNFTRLKGIGCIPTT